MSLLDTIRANIRQALDERAAAQTKIDGILKTVEDEKRNDMSPEETEQFAAARADVAKTDENVKALRAREAELVEMEEAKDAADKVARSLPTTSTPPVAPVLPETSTAVAVRSEPRTYNRGGEFSYFRDLARVMNPGEMDSRANDRIERHAQEVYVEQRTNMSRTDGQGGEFVPPAWLMDEIIPLARAGRITAELCNKMPLPSGTDSINLPKVSTGATSAEQTEAAAVSNTDITTTSVAGAVTTFAGQQVFSMQLLDQSPVNVDQVVFADLIAAMNAAVDTYVISKASIGIINVSSIIAVTYTDASPTVPELYPKLADCIQQIQTNRFLAPQAWVMHPRRWAWMLAALDSSNRPLVVPSQQGPQNAFAGFGDVRAEGSVGSLQGLPVYVDPNMGTTLGAGTEDKIIAARFDDLYLFEGDLRTRILFETDANTLQVRVQVWEYGAFIGNRYPKSIGVISGTGLIAPTF